MKKSDSLKKEVLNAIKDKKIKSILEKQSERVWHAVKCLYIWHKTKGEKFPVLAVGSSGSSKSYITELLFQGLLGKDAVKRTVPPSDGNYSDHIENQITGRQFDLLIIDEAHKYHFDIETIQPHKTGLTIGESFVRYDQLIFISHAGLGKNTSEDARLNMVEYGTPQREEIISLLVDHEGYSKSKAEWCAWHAPRNIHNAKSVSEKYGTDLQETVNPCGLAQTDLDLLKLYRDLEELGSNTLSVASGKLSLDVNAAKNSERRLRAESLLITGKQSKREVTETGLDLLYTIFGDESEELETKQKTPQKETPKKATPKSPSKSKAQTSAKPQTKQTGKAKGKASAKSKAQSKQAQAPKMTGKSKAAEIATEINSDNLKKPNPLDKVGE